jgi:hypothetical protein
MSVDGGAGAIDPSHQPAGGAPVSVRLQVLTTEHWSLLASRQLAWSESFARASMFLMTLSGSIVALALVAQAQQFGRDFELFALAILPVPLFVGVATFLRLGAANYHDAQCVIGMNRIRGAYLELAPDLEPYFVMSPHDDVPGVGITMAVDPSTKQWVHLVAATPAMVGIVTAAVAAAFTAIVGDLVSGGSAWAAVAGAVVGGLGMLLRLVTWARRGIAEGQTSIRPLFPTPAERTD